jgi:NAD(P)-dependent dehydrogenase (short-subunit alcohol dehydrogenase family)
MDLNNKVVVVTGAGRGLGRGIAEALASRGAHRLRGPQRGRPARHRGPL